MKYLLLFYQSLVRIKLEYNTFNLQPYETSIHNFDLFGTGFFN